MTAGSTHSSATTAHQPPAAERARTVAARPAASLYCAGLGISQLWGAATTRHGDVLLVVPTAGAVTTALADSPLGDVPARLTVTDRTSLPLAHPVRGLVQLSGWVTPVTEEHMARLVLDFADAHACDALFDVGLTATLVRLDLAEVVLEEAGMSTDVEPEDFLAARPDVVSAAEAELMAAERCALDRLSGRVQRWAGRQDDVRLLGLDRFGVRFRVQSRRGCYDVRVPFESPLEGPDGFGAAVEHLLRCGPA
ncbi:DUF2470 domain-containing protein [Blastococcus haudaquaticus]|uniref:DUF2470 domain-containing protein n=1 Tax=Blastococcus haudaquaticus TaxID=1938745 RepID=A0A286H7L6_9ACTN|nr:DUF2470 domain-containing protein [Blastococcus haudaquaticus]SOE03790.1 hypothetical protein SAMN06272739_4347 [Blastococcus haudaquaticus]